MPSRNILLRLKMAEFARSFMLLVTSYTCSVTSAIAQLFHSAQNSPTAEIPELHHHATTTTHRHSGLPTPLQSITSKPSFLKHHNHNRNAHAPLRSTLHNSTTPHLNHNSNPTLIPPHLTTILMEGEQPKKRWLCDECHSITMPCLLTLNSATRDQRSTNLTRGSLPCPNPVRPWPQGHDKQQSWLGEQTKILDTRVWQLRIRNNHVQDYPQL